MNQIQSFNVYALVAFFGATFAAGFAVFAVFATLATFSAGLISFSDVTNPIVLRIAVCLAIPRPTFWVALTLNF